MTPKEKDEIQTIANKAIDETPLPLHDQVYTAREVLTLHKQYKLEAKRTVANILAVK